MLERLRDDETPFLHDVVSGLSAQQKSIPPKYFYDERGSELFDAICDLPEYYPTRTEIGLLSQLAPVLRDSLDEFDHLIEYGSGASRKTRIVLRALRRLRTYVPIDVSEEFLLAVAARLQTDFPRLQVEPLVGDFTGALTLPVATREGRSVGFFPGSTIGNLGPEGAASFLVNARKSLGEHSAFLLGADLVKDANVLRAAYNDGAGVTAQFNLNLLSRINRELGGDFDERAFRHVAIWNPSESRIEMHLVSEQPQTVTLAGHEFSFRAGETIHTENSYKFTPERLRALAEGTGWRVRNVWTDGQYPFAVALFAAA